MAVGAALWDDLLEGEEVAHLETIPPADARMAPLPDELHPRVRGALDARGLDTLYVHQRAVWDAALRGEHVVVTTGTASGKSLAFNLPVLDAIARGPKHRALYLYPTKALAQDQARALAELKPPKVRAAIYDGDTPTERRWQIRKWANVILTNPDMLHIGVLPHHDRWADVLHNLRYVVVDEAHVYRGVFGSHVGNVLRRLRRLARVYGADPQFLLATATIANPAELASALAGVRATSVDMDAAPRAERTIALWNPEPLDQYFMRDPDALLGRRVEGATLDHANPRVLDGHVRAAAFEAPIDDADRDLLGDEALERAALIPELKRTKSGYVWAGRDYPAAQTNLRSANADSFTVIEAETGTVLGIVERERAYSTVHEGAVYLHLGDSYLVRELDLTARTAVVTPYAGDYYTQAKKETSTAIEEALRTEQRCGLELTFGRISVTEQVVAYQKKSVRDQATLETVPLDLPETSFETEAVWYLPEPEMLDKAGALTLLRRMVAASTSAS